MNKVNSSWARFFGVLGAVAASALLAPLSACSAAPAPPTTAFDNADGATAADAIAPDASTPPLDAQALDGAANFDSASAADAGLNPAAPHPPVGFVLCKNDVFDAASARAACLAYVPVPGARPPYCDGATLISGRYEVWCKGEDRWSWARFDGVRRTAQFPTCASGSVLLGGAYASTQLGSGAGGDHNFSSCNGAASGCALSNGDAGVVTFERLAEPKSTSQSFYVTMSALPFTCPAPAANAITYYTIGVTMVL
jgi:hypothetical protein